MKTPKLTGKDLLWEAARIVIILTGAALSAWATDVFALPYNILMGGATGVGRIINHFTGLPISGLVMGVNILLLTAAGIFLGRKYVTSIILGSISYPIFLEIFSRVSWAKEPVLEDPLLAAISGGALMGVALGMILRVGGSLGGSDVCPLIVHKKFGWPLATFMYVQDSAILLLQAFNASLTEIVLAICMVFVYTAATNKVITMGHGLVQFQIYSKRTEEILNALIQFGVGATMLHGKSGYRREDVEMISSVFTVHYMNRVKRMILSIDPTAFITITMVQEVNGRGFTIENHHRDFTQAP